jgi:hypothetical protein
MRAYKAFDKDLKYRNFQYKVGKSYHYDGEIISCKAGFHACEDMNDCFSTHSISSRIFEVKLFGTIKEELAKHCASDIKIIRELSEPEIISKLNSRWACCYCLKIKDSKDVRDRITDSYWAYFYCFNIKDRKEIRDRITESKWAYWYCHVVEDRKEVRDRITESEWAYWYCHDIKDRKEVRDRITESRWAYWYCRYVKDREEVRDRITSKHWLNKYNEWKNERENKK